MHRLAIAVLLLVGCSRPETQPNAPMGSAQPELGASAKNEPAPAAPKPAKPDDDVASDDPWGMRAADPDDPPSLTHVHELADKACPRVAKPYFYRVEKGGVTSYMLGTRHLGVALSKMPANVKQQLVASKLVVFEIAPGDDSGGSSDRRPKIAISDALGPDLWARYKKLVGATIASNVEHASPTMAMLQLIALYEDRTAALDGEIEKLVEDAHIATGGLETSAFQDKLLVELMDVRMLKATVAGTPDRATMEKESQEDLAEYCAGTDEESGTDERARKQLIAGGYTAKEIDALDDKLVYARNRDWIPKLEKLFATGGVTVVVGADHLIGQKGVIAALAARGWKTARVPASP